MTREFGENREWLLNANAQYSYFYHVHNDEDPTSFYIVTKEWKCRKCGKQPDKGIRFMAATAKLTESL